MSWLALAVVAAVAMVAFVAGGRVALRRASEQVPSPPPVPADPAIADVLEVLHLGVAVASRDGADEFRNSAARTMAGTHTGVIIDDAIARHLDRGLCGIRSDELIELHGPPKAVFVVESAPLPGGGAVAFVEDVSERRRIDQVRTDFVANVSHELKTPIGALAVLAEMLHDERDIETIQRIAGRMVAETERAANTVDDLMELSRIELGGDRVVEEVRIAGVVAAAAERVQELAAQRSISISTLGVVDDTGRRADDVLVDGDRRQLASALGNLIENAVKYSDSGSSVHVRVRRIDDVVEIAVVDHGTGIPSGDLDRVFERFYRVDQARSRETGGSGLGLSIVRHVATSHGGEVSIASTEGAGSTFSLRLPVSAAESTSTGMEDVLSGELDGLADHGDEGAA